MLHPQVRAWLDAVERGGAPALQALNVAEARAIYGKRRTVVQPAPPEVARVLDLQAASSTGPIPLRLYRPYGAEETAVLPALVYYHGGGYVFGDLDSHDVLCRQLANLAGCAVVAAGYRLAPEHPFPAAVLDSIAAAHWVHEHAGELRVDHARLAVGGDSAGGTLAAVVSIAARDRGDLPIVLQVLVYPLTDAYRRCASHRENGQGYVLTRELMDYFAACYTPDRSSYSDWRVSPLLHPDLSRLPPAVIVTAGFDPLRDEGAEYAQRLTAAGTPASYVCFDRQIHGFLNMAKVIDEANTAVALCAGELRRVFALSRVT